MKLSVVTSLFHSGPYLREFHKRLSAAVHTVTDSYEVIYVNDGSPDDSLAIALDIRSSDPRVKVVDLSANFGHHRALMTGLRLARGERVFLLDSDLEEPPELLSVFSEKLDAGGCDVAYGVREKRGGGLFNKATGKIFYLLLSNLTELAIPDNVMTARLMTRRYVDSLLKYTESDVYLAGILHEVGYVQQPVVVNALRKSATTYTLRRKMNLALNAITAFSSKPLVIVFYFGLLMAAAALAASAGLVISHYFFERRFPGWTSIIVSIWFLGGLIILFTGMVGIYVAKAFNEVKNRPITIIRDIYELEAEDPADPPPMP